jgi:predicted nucleic acid-binding protein
MNLVVDASIAVEYLLRTELGQRAAGVLDAGTLFAPELLDVEVAAVLRRAVHGKHLAVDRAAEALADLLAWDLTRISHRAVLERAWTLRDNATAYDSMYLAIAQLQDATIVTADGPLSRIPLRGFTIQNFS